MIEQRANSRSWKRFARLAPFLALGPITGVLAAGLMRSWRSGHPILAGLYAVAIMETWTLMASAAAAILPTG